MKIEVKDLLPNPFRHLERYPINRDKVEALKHSIKDTEFWDNLLVRKVPDGGGYEMAYGHHRLVALKELRYGEIDVPVRKLDDTTMAKIMANENMDEWGHDAAIEQETVRGIVEGIGAGRIKMPIRKHAGSMYYDAASDVPFAPLPLPEIQKRAHEASRPYHLYTIDAFCDFLGWKRYKIESAISSIGLIEREMVDEETIKGLSSKQADVLTDQVRRVERETGKKGLAKTIGKKLAAGMKKATKGRDAAGHERSMQDVTIHNAKRVTDEMMGKDRRATAVKPIPDVEAFIATLTQQLQDTPAEKLVEKINRLIQVKVDLLRNDKRGLVSALRAAAKRFEKLADRLDG